MSEWISVKEGLPPIKIEHLMSNRRVIFYNGISAYLGYYSLESNTWFDDSSPKAPVPVDNVILWVPLPELPK